MVVCCLEYEQIFNSYIRLYFPMALVKPCYILLLPATQALFPRLLKELPKSRFPVSDAWFMFLCLVWLLQLSAVVGVIPSPSLPRRCGSWLGNPEVLGSTWK